MKAESQEVADLFCKLRAAEKRAAEAEARATALEVDNARLRSAIGDVDDTIDEALGEWAAVDPARWPAIIVPSKDGIIRTRRIIKKALATTPTEGGLRERIERILSASLDLEDMPGTIVRLTEALLRDLGGAPDGEVQ